MVSPPEKSLGVNVRKGCWPTQRNPLVGGSVCVAYVVALATMWCAWQATLRMDGLDYFTFWEVIQCRRDPDLHLDKHGIYGIRSQQRIGLAAERTLSQAGLSARQRSATQANLRLYQGRIETTATPFFYASLVPLVTGNYERDFRLFTTMSLAAHVASIALLCWIMGYSPAMTGWCIALLGPALFTVSIQHRRAQCRFSPSISSCGGCGTFFTRAPVSGNSHSWLGARPEHRLQADDLAGVGHREHCLAE